MAQIILVETGLIMEDTKTRSIIKTFSWRITGSSATFLIAWIIGGDLAVAGTIAMTQIVANTMLYYLHERVWNLVTWGRINTVSKEINQ
jgi:uncharacterized membrane protein